MNKKHPAIKAVSFIAAAAFVFACLPGCSEISSIFGFLRKDEIETADGGSDYTRGRYEFEPSDSGSEDKSGNSVSSAKDFSYSMLDDGSAMLTAYNGKSELVTTPTKIGDAAVTAIGQKVFYYNEYVKEITVSAGVTAIGERSFYQCNNLLSVSLPASVASLPTSPFCFCPSLIEISVAGSNTAYAAIDGVLFNEAKTELLCYPSGKAGEAYEIPSGVVNIGAQAFKNSDFLCNIAISSSVSNISDGAFYNCDSLQSVTIPNGVATIGADAFKSCAVLGSVVISSSVIGINKSSFSECPLLKNFTVEAGNTAYCSVDGILFDKSMKTLLCYPSAKNTSEYTVPDSVTALDSEAFWLCRSLINLTVHPGVTRFGSKAVSNCSDMTLVVKDGSPAHKYATDNKLRFELG